MPSWHHVWYLQKWRSDRRSRFLKYRIDGLVDAARSGKPVVITEVQKNKENPPFIVIKSWNEWAEGNHLEPDSTYGRQWLEVVKIIKDSL